MRLFMGLAIPDDPAREMEQRTREAASRWTGTVRLMPASDLHITLRFLGETDATRVPELGAALERVGGAAFRARLSTVGIFRGPGAVYAKIERSEELRRLQDAVSETLAWSGVARERREFHPHVTLARRRHGLPQPELDRWSASWVPLDVALQWLVLYQSVSGPDGTSRRYERLQEVQLKDARGSSDNA